MQCRPGPTIQIGALIRTAGTSDTDDGADALPAAAADEPPDEASRAVTLQRILLHALTPHAGCAAEVGSCGAGGRRGQPDAVDSTGASITGSARRFIACHMLHDALLAAAKRGAGACGKGSAGSVADVGPEEVAALLVEHRAALEARGGVLSEIVDAGVTWRALRQCPSRVYLASQVSQFVSAAPVSECCTLTAIAPPTSPAQTARPRPWTRRAHTPLRGACSWTAPWARVARACWAGWWRRRTASARTQTRRRCASRPRASAQFQAAQQHQAARPMLCVAGCRHGPPGPWHAAGSTLPLPRCGPRRSSASAARQRWTRAFWACTRCSSASPPRCRCAGRQGHGSVLRCKRPFLEVPPGYQAERGPRTPDSAQLLNMQSFCHLCPSSQDDGVSVREAAVELLAKHIVSDPGLAEDYFEVLVEASRVRPAGGVVVMGLLAGRSSRPRSTAAGRVAASDLGTKAPAFSCFLPCSRTMACRCASARCARCGSAVCGALASPARRTQWSPSCSGEQGAHAKRMGPAKGASSSTLVVACCA